MVFPDWSQPSFGNYDGVDVSKEVWPWPTSQNGMQSGLVVIFVFFLSDSYAILCRLKSVLLEKHADAHASSMLATDNNNNNNLSEGGE